MRKKEIVQEIDDLKAMMWSVLNQLEDRIEALEESAKGIKTN